MSRKRSALYFVVACLWGCASNPPPRWQQGGAHLDLRSASWARRESTVELKPTGEVVEDDELVFRVDGSGRVSDPKGDPVAVLMPDGYLMAVDESLLGWVGGGTSFVGKDRAPVIYMFQTGQVLSADEDAEWSVDGQWTGCEGHLLWTCTLVSHIVLVRDRARGGGGGGSGAGDVLKLLELLKLFH